MVVTVGEGRIRKELVGDGRVEWWANGGRGEMRLAWWEDGRGLVEGWLAGDGRGAGHPRSISCGNMDG